MEEPDVTTKLLPDTVEAESGDGSNDTEAETHSSGGGGGALFDLLKDRFGNYVPWLEELDDIYKNFEWTNPTDLIARIKEKIEIKLKEYLKPFKEYFEENKLLMYYLTISIFILLIPILLFVVFIFIAIGLGFLVFAILEGVLVIIGILFLVVLLIPIVLILALVGLVVFVINWIIRKVTGSSSTTDNPETDKPESDLKPSDEASSEGSAIGKNLNPNASLNGEDESVKLNSEEGEASS